MKIIVFSILILVVLLIAASLWWRRAARYHFLPCPFWLSWLLESPYMEAVTGSSLILERLNLVTGMRVLDAGCGTGRATIPIAKKVGLTGQVVALDMQAAMLEKVRRKAEANGLTNIWTVMGRIGQGVLEHNFFDRALLVHVLGEIPISDREAALHEIYMTLKRGGILSVTETIPDPHYQDRGTVLRLVKAVGFRFHHYYGNWFTFTMNFIKPKEN